MRSEFGAERWFSRGHSALTRPRSWRAIRSETEPRSGPTAMCSRAPPLAGDAISATIATSSRVRPSATTSRSRISPRSGRGHDREWGLHRPWRHVHERHLPPIAANEAGSESLQRARVACEDRCRRGATLGAGSVVVAGLTIGAHAFVGAGAVVTHDVPSFALVVGNPARVKGWVCVCGSRLDFVQTTRMCETAAFGIPPNGNGGGDRLNRREERTRDIEPGHPSLTGTGAGSWREDPEAWSCSSGTIRIPRMNGCVARR